MSVLDPPPAPYAPPRPQPTRALTGRVLFVEDHAGGRTGMFNDGIGSAAPDFSVAFGGKPTIRLDPQGQVSSATPGTTQILTLGGSAATYTTSGGGGTLVGTTSQSPSPSVTTTGGYILLPGLASNGPTTDGNSYALSYSSAVIGGSSGSWTVTFSGVLLMALPLAPATSVTTSLTGSPTFVVGNPTHNPGATPSASGVVFKRRIADSFSGQFGFEAWARPTSASAANSQTSLFSLSLYNRDGYNWWGARLFILPAVGQSPGGSFGSDTAIAYLLTGTSSTGFTWAPAGYLTQSSWAQNTWDPVNGTWDAAGSWHYFKLVADFSAHEYISIQVDDQTYPADTGVPLYQSSPDTGPKSMHFSAELGQTTSTRRFWHLGQVTGTKED